MKSTKLMLGDNIESLKKLPDNSIDSIVTDPPYGLSFMNKKWDYDVPSVEFWIEVYRVLKPGGHVLSFGGTRTYHRMVVNIEDAGFEIRDQIMWLYGSGFPKSLNIGKAVDKIQGNEREVVGEKTGGAYSSGTNNKGIGEFGLKWRNRGDDFGKITKGQSDWEGWGTALKPANEPICLARKPLSEKSVAENVLKWGTGGINVDGCRVGSETITINRHNLENLSGMGMGQTKNMKWGDNVVKSEGRFPANLILECICDEVIKGEKGEFKKYLNININKQDKDRKINNSTNGINVSNYNDKGDIHTNPNCPCRLMDEQSGVSKSSPFIAKNTGYGKSNTYINYKEGGSLTDVNGGFSDTGGASRFFYQAKVSKKERNMGLDGFEDIKKTSLQVNMKDGKIPESHKRFESVVKNSHPTVKPVNLMTYLCRLITPPGGIVLDPFMGSGSTGIAAQLEGFRFVGMEMDPDYFKIAEVRINSFEEYRKFIK